MWNLPILQCLPNFKQYIFPNKNSTKKKIFFFAKTILTKKRLWAASLPPKTHSLISQSTRLFLPPPNTVVFASYRPGLRFSLFAAPLMMKIYTLYCHRARCRATDVSQFQKLISCTFYRSDMFTQEIVFLLEGCRKHQVNTTLGFSLQYPGPPRWLLPRTVTAISPHMPSQECVQVEISIRLVNQT